MKSEQTQLNTKTLDIVAELLFACKKMRNSIRHANYCKAPSCFPCTCDADQLWEESAVVIAKAEKECQ